MNLLHDTTRARKRFYTAPLALLTLLACGAAAGDELADAALERTRHQVTYDGAYRRIAFPNGDVPLDTGVCTDLVIRSYRKLGIDLQRLVHEDMRRHFDAYPKNWGLARPDTNIDHRRVPNLETFFERNGQSFAPSEDEAAYESGDIVSWRLAGGLPHIGIVGNRMVPGTRRHFVIHNIGRGPKEEDVLFAYRVQGHYRYRK